MDKYFYITTTLPYVNAKPHLGFAMEIIRADVVARYKRYLGYKVFFNTGTDEHGQKLLLGAKEHNLSPQAFVDQNAKSFQQAIKLLNISNDAFIRTTDEKHIKAAQRLWQIVKENGYIYKKNYKMKYCVGCECEKQNSELGENGKCLIHSDQDLEEREEENYFFAFSKFQEKLLTLYNENSKFVIPDFRLLEIKSFVKSGLQDFSISRLKSKMSWGISVPDDEEHVMYVWFDALTNYISTLGWGSDDESNFQKFWLQAGQEREVVQYCGKDNLRYQAATWQAMLMAANIPISTNIIIDGFILSNGQKMSKSIGNVLSPFEVIEEYKSVTDFPEEVLRFVLTYDISNFEDSDVTYESIKQSYITHLQNGLGNQVNRILKLTSNNLKIEDVNNILKEAESKDVEIEFKEYMEDFKLHEAVHFIMDKQKALDEYIQETAPFKLLKSEVEKDLIKGKEILRKCLAELLSISHHLYFFMPKTAYKIYELVKVNQMPEKPLFGRVN